MILFVFCDKFYWLQYLFQYLYLVNIENGDILNILKDFW